MGRLVALALAALGAFAMHAEAQTRERVDVALVLAVDVSGSVDTNRFALQMEGIAAALESSEVTASILSGPHHAMLVALVQWSDRPSLSLPWTLVTRADDIRDVAARVRRLRRAEGNFTCMSVALRNIADKLVTQLPVPADHLVVDVSGDGHDNCNPVEPVGHIRDELAFAGVTVNGLPILEGDEAGTVEGWYREHVIGGPNAFLIPAAGYADFERAMRRKFVTEVSAAPCAGCVRAASRVGTVAGAPRTAQFINCRVRSSEALQAPSSFWSSMRAFSSSILASDMRSFGAALPAWPGVVSTDLPDPLAATAAAVGSPSCCLRTSCGEVAIRLPTEALASLVPVVPPIRPAADVPAADGTADCDAAALRVSPDPVSVPDVTGPRLGFCDNFRPSSAI